MDVDALQAEGLRRKEQMISEVGLILRSKGFTWNMSCEGYIVEWNHGGRILSIAAAQKWFSLTPESHWGLENEKDIQVIKDEFLLPYGDKRQEIVFIGANLNKENITSTLDNCCMSAEEIYAWMNNSKPMENKEPVDHMTVVVTCARPYEVRVPRGYALELDYAELSRAVAKKVNSVKKMKKFRILPPAKYPLQLWVRHLSICIVPPCIYIYMSHIKQRRYHI